MFDKFGFCKEREKCERTHLVEVCVQEECDARKCDKRHPRACKYYQQNGYCKFKSDCKTTIGVDFNIKNVEIDGKTIKAQIWDTAVSIFVFNS